MNKYTRQGKSNTKDVFSTKVKELHNQIVNNKIKFTEVICSTLLSLVNGDTYKDFLTTYSNNSDKIVETHTNLLACIHNIDNSGKNNLLVISVNKICGVTEYNDHVNKLLNEDDEFLLEMISVDKNVVKKLVNKDENFYIRLLKFVKIQNIINVFKALPAEAQTYLVCKTAIERECTIIKYVIEQTEILCELAMIHGHTNLADIKFAFHTDSICSKYVKLDKNNIKHITHKSNLSDNFFMKLVEEDSACISMIDDMCKFPRLNTYIVSKNGLLIRYIPPYMQTFRLIELAVSQNQNAKYYVTYENPPFCADTMVQNITSTVDKLKRTYHVEKLFTPSIHLNTHSNSISTDTNTNITKTNFYVMSSENYMNHQYQMAIENKYEPNIDVFDLGMTKFFKKNKIEFASLVDNDNRYVAFFEIVN